MIQPSPRVSIFGVLVLILLLSSLTLRELAKSRLSLVNSATAQKPIALMPAASDRPSLSEPTRTTPEESPKYSASLVATELWDDSGFVPFLQGKKVATIIEDRALDNLMPIILHFASVLGPEWPIVLFTSIDVNPISAAIRRLMNQDRLFIKQLPNSVHFSDHASVSAFLTKPWLWHQLAPADHVLLFQADSMICGNSPQSIEDFLQYDLIGAPIDTTRFGEGYNGGLSLRNRNRILDIIYASNFDNETHVDDNIVANVNVDFEDQWFYKKMMELAVKPSPSGDGSTLPGANLPSQEIAMKFAVETISYEWPLGYHQPARFQPGRMEQIERWCPEVRMVTTDLIALRGEKQKDCQEKLNDCEAKSWQDLKREQEESTDAKAK